MNVQILKQMTIEDRYAKHNIRNWMLKELEESGLEKLYNKGNVLLMKYFNGDYYDSKTERIKQLGDMDISKKDVITETILIILDGDQTYQTVCGRLSGLFNYEDVFDGVRTAAEIIAVLEPLGLYKIVSAKESETGSLYVESFLEADDELKQKISDTKYLPPLICMPKYIRSNKESQWFTKDFDSVLLNNSHHNGYQALDAINIANAIELSLDEWVLTLEEKPNKELDTPQKVDQFVTLKNSSRKVYDEILEEGNSFWFAWKFDKRGRMYSQGYHINIQSTEYKKALINFKEEILIC